MAALYHGMYNPGIDGSIGGVTKMTRFLVSYISENVLVHFTLPNRFKNNISKNHTNTLFFVKPDFIAVFVPWDGLTSKPFNGAFHICCPFCKVYAAVIYTF